MHTLAVGRGPISRAVKNSVKAVTPDGLRRRALRTTRERLLYVEPQAPDEELMRQLRRRFKGEVQAAGEYLNRDLVSLWGYEGLS